MTQVTVYVPAAGYEKQLGIKAKAAVVGTPTTNPDAPGPIVASILGKGLVTIDYEGGLYDNMTSYADKLLHAAGRHVERYPTVARQFVPEDLVLAVGTYDTETRELVVDDSEKLGSWLGLAFPSAHDALVSA